MARERYLVPTIAKIVLKFRFRPPGAGPMIDSRWHAISASQLGQTARFGCALPFQKAEKSAENNEGNP